MIVRQVMIDKIEVNNKYWHDILQGKVEISLIALQAGGSFGSYAAGLMCGFIKNTNIKFKAVSGSSAGAISAVYIAGGLNGLKWPYSDEAKLSLCNSIESFWLKKSAVNDTGVLGGFRICFKMIRYLTATFCYMVSFGRIKSPLIPLLKDINFDAANKSDIRCFTNAVHVSGTKNKLTTQPDICLETTQASASIPFIFPPVKFSDGYYVDGASHNMLVNKHVARNPAIIEPLNAMYKGEGQELFLSVLLTKPVIDNEGPAKSFRRYLTKPYYKELEYVNEARKAGRDIVGFEIEIPQIHPLLQFWPSGKMMSKLFNQGLKDAEKYIKEVPKSI